jgi:hypothetical protein
MTTKNANFAESESRTIPKSLPVVPQRTIIQVPEELKQKVIDAVGTGKYFITISCQAKDEGSDNLQHHYMTNGYPRDELNATLKHIEGMVRQKEFRGVGSDWT